MRRHIALASAVGLVTVVMTVMMPIAAAAQNQPLKGHWVISLATPLGVLSGDVTFKKHGDGAIEIASEEFPIVYREAGASFSFAFEPPPAFSGTPATWIIRGTKATDDSFSGVILLIPDAPPNTIPVGTATGTRR